MEQSSSPETRPQKVSRTAVLKLLIVIAVVIAIARGSLGTYWAVVVCGAAVGMFLAEHFGNSKSREVLMLLIFPLIVASIATIVPLVGQRAALGDILLWALLGFFVAVAPAAISIVGLSVLSAFVHRVTGIRLLKYEWNRSGSPEHQAGT